jgi:DNA-binding response OmpR family regulator
VNVLVVEDERRLGQALRRGLSSEGFAVDLALDGSEGLWLATERSYDLILLDIMLPGINGYKVCAQLRAEGNWTPILMLTAKDGEYDEAEALDTGADDYLSKPFSYVVLLARIRSLLRRRLGERPAVLSCGSLSMDPASRRCRRGAQEIALTAREWHILAHLMRHQEQVVSKQEIIEHVWDFGFDGAPNVLEVHISALRRKVDAPFDLRSIRTVRGAGYVLVADGDS